MGPRVGVEGLIETAGWGVQEYMNVRRSHRGNVSHRLHRQRFGRGARCRAGA